MVNALHANQKQLWKPDYLKEYRRRINLVISCRKDPKAWAILKKVYGNGYEGCIRWINDFAVTYDPRNKPPTPRTMPFILFPRQEDMVQFVLECLRDGESGLIEKCRDFGATWVCAAISVWLWLFHPGTSVGWGSRKSDLVDEIGNPDSILEKMRIIIRNLPDFMLPVGYSMSHMKFINPVGGSTIAGETGDNIGRGGRSTIYFKDESAHYERPELIEAALGDNTDVQIDISSVNGPGNVFHRKRKSGQLWAPGKPMEKHRVRVLILDWRQNPMKNQEWYNGRRKKAEREGLQHIFAQEVDRDYSASMIGTIIPAKWVEAAIDADKVLKFPQGGEKVSALDVADGGRDANAQCSRTGVTLDFLATWPFAEDVGISAMNAVNNCRMLNAMEFYYDCIGIGAGVKVQTNRLAEDGKLPSMLRIYPWNAAESPKDKEQHVIPTDIKSPKNEDIFQNLKSQGWFLLAQRFQKTYKAVVHGEVYDWQELISIDSSIDNLEDLKVELSQPVWAKQQKSGKMLVDKTPDGTKSPNLADCVMMDYHPVKELSILDVI